MSKSAAFLMLSMCVAVAFSQENPEDKCTRVPYHLGLATSVTITCRFDGPITVTEDFTYAAIHGARNVAKEKEDALVDAEASEPREIFYRLVMDNSGINGIEEGGFGYEPKLKELRLKGNDLTSLGRYTFVGAPNVEQLDLAENSISTVQSRSFVPMRRLKSLDMNHNKLTTISFFTFQGLGQVTYLSLTNNNISDWRSAAFAALWNLEYLHLSYNHISSLDGARMAGMNALKFLDLSGNQISTIADGAFNGKPKLETLDLSGNQLTEITAQTFRGLTSLKTLNLRGNIIRSIDDRAFAHMPVMRELDISHNGLSTLSRGMFIGLVNLNSFNAADNWMQQVALSPDPEFDEARSDLVQAIGLICRKPGIYYADLSGNALETMLQNVSQRDLGFDFSDRSQHFCVF